MNIEWNKVTRFSQSIAIILFFVVGALGFWLGSVYSEVLDIQEDTFLSDAQIMPFNNVVEINAHEHIRTLDWEDFLTRRFAQMTECASSSIDIRQVEYGDLNGDGAEEAIVTYYTCMNGTGGAESEVLTIDYQGHPVRLMVNNSGATYGGENKLFEGFGGHGYYSISPQNQLVFTYPIYKTGDANCCATGGIKNIYYVWSALTQQFEIETVQIEPIESLEAPGAITASGNEVALMLPSRECNKTYKIERSYNKRDWDEVKTVTFFEHEHDPDRPACEKDYLDSTVPIGTTKLFYRYALVGENGFVEQRSLVGEVVIEQ